MTQGGKLTLWALMILATLPATADIYKYRMPDGRLVISNEPPPPGAQKIDRRRETGKPLSSGTAALAHRPVAPRGRVKPALKYIDHHPLVVTKHDVHGTDVWWKKWVVTWVKNRSGRTTAASVKVKTTCYNDRGKTLDTISTYVSSIPPRGVHSAKKALLIAAYRPPKRIECESKLEWRNLH